MYVYFSISLRFIYYILLNIALSILLYSLSLGGGKDEDVRHESWKANQSSEIKRGHGN